MTVMQSTVPSQPSGSLDDQQAALLALAAQDAEVDAIVREAEDLTHFMPMMAEAPDVNTYRFTLGGNAELSL